MTKYKAIQYKLSSQVWNEIFKDEASSEVHILFKQIFWYSHCSSFSPIPIIWIFLNYGNFKSSQNNTYLHLSNNRHMVLFTLNYKLVNLGYFFQSHIQQNFIYTKLSYPEISGRQGLAQDHKKIKITK